MSHHPDPDRHTNQDKHPDREPAQKPQEVRGPAGDLSDYDQNYPDGATPSSGARSRPHAGRTSREPDRTRQRQR